MIELLVAMPLAALAVAAAAIILVRVARTSRAQAAMLANASGVRHASLVMAADLAPLNGRDLVTVTDTLLEFRGHLGVLLVCGTQGTHDVIVASPLGAPDAWLWTIRAGDQVHAWKSPEAPAAAPQSVMRHVIGPQEALAPSTCGMGSSTHQRWRIPLADSGAAPTIGSPLLVTRSVRYQHYRSGSSWWLGRRSRNGTEWDGLQPVVGPLTSPSGGGVVLRAQSADGANLVLSASLPDSVAARIFGLEVTVRMPRRVAEHNAGRSDSATVLIPFRAAASGSQHP